MIIQLEHNGKNYQADLKAPIDISIPLVSKEEQVNCFYAPPFKTYPFESGDFIGSTKKGSPVNFYNVELNPHGNGTHTECVGHISKEGETINQTLKTFHFIARLISVNPSIKENGDRVVDFIDECFTEDKPEALIIRTLPNQKSKKSENYSGQNPCYIDAKIIQKIVDAGIDHFVVDLPSIDREEDEGKLLGHKTFWNFLDKDAANRTISELVYIEDTIKDGLYLINIQIASFELDASPSKIVLFELMQK